MKAEVEQVHQVQGLVRTAGATKTLGRCASSYCYNRLHRACHQSWKAGYFSEQFWHNFQFDRTTQRKNSFLFVGHCNALCFLKASLAHTADPINKFVCKNNSKTHDYFTYRITTRYKPYKQKLLTSPPVDQLPRVKSRSYLDSNVWNRPFRSVLHEEHLDGAEKPLRYWSRYLTKINVTKSPSANALQSYVQPLCRVPNLK